MAPTLKTSKFTTDFYTEFCVGGPGEPDLNGEPEKFTMLKHDNFYTKFSTGYCLRKWRP